MCFHRARVHPRHLCNLFQLHLFHKAQDKDAALLGGKLVDRLPDALYLGAGNKLRLRRTAAIWHPVAHIHWIEGRLPRLRPEAQAFAAQVVAHQVHGDLHQLRAQAGVAAKMRPPHIRLEKAVLRQVLRHIPVAQRRQQKPKDPWTVQPNDLVKIRKVKDGLLSRQVR